MEVSQTLQGKSYIVEAYNRVAYLEGFRYFYIVDKKSGDVWNPNYVPLNRPLDSFVCNHGIASSEVVSIFKDIEVKIKATVPQNELVEHWQISVKNMGATERDLAVYTAFGIYDHGVMGGECVYDESMQAIVKYAYPYHTFFEDKVKVENQKAYTYVFADATPSSWDMSQQRFFGSPYTNEVPAGIVNGELSKTPAEAEAFCGAMAFPIFLTEGTTYDIALELGTTVTKAEIADRKKAFSQEKLQADVEKMEAYWESEFSNFHIKTPDDNINYFANYWLQKQATLLTRQNRGSSYCPIRNQLQDAMGYAVVQPEKAKPFLVDILKVQNQDGFVQQWHDTTGVPPRGLCLLRHTDGPIWLAICTEFVIRQIGDDAFLQEVVPYKDGGEASVFEHICNAMKYLFSDLGTHGICLIGDGDWNDPMNGVGTEGKGESIWLSMALIYGVKIMMPYLEKYDSEKALFFKKSVDTMTENLHKHAWDGKWYAAAIHDDGNLVGGVDDRVFLNTQSWAVLSGVATAEQKEILGDVWASLDTPFGPLLLDRPFDGWEPRWGRVSIKKSGTTENASIYCHASMFYAMAQGLEKDGDGMYETLYRTLPTNPENPPSHNLQAPIYLSNYYYGLRDSKNFGRSSQHYGTGTVAWFLSVTLEQLCGVYATTEGIFMNPCLPKDWNNVRCKRKYRGATYEIAILRTGKEVVTVDGVSYDGQYLPCENGKTYIVEVQI